jgi:hypothetical protein
MKPLAVLRPDRPTGRAGPLGRDRVRARSLDPAPRGGECGPASQAFGEYDAKDVDCGPHHNRPANLKPNIYYKAQDFTLGARRAPGGRVANRADRHLTGTAGEEREPIGPEPVAWLAEDAACDW